VIDGLLDEDDVRADVAVIFGNTVHEDGTLSVRLEKRLEAGYDLWKKEGVPRIIVSGAVGKEGHDEALVMKEYLVSRGMPESDILVDSDGINTRATAAFVKQLVDKNGWNSVCLVTQYHHMTRAKLAFHQAGVAQVFGVHARLFEWRDLYAIIREYIAYYSYLIGYYI